MAWDVTSLVSSRIVGGQSRKLLLLVMGDRANKDGSGVYMSYATMAAATEMNRSTVKRLIQTMEAEGLLIKIGLQPCDNGWTNDYTINIPMLRDMPLSERKTGGATPPVQDAPGLERDRGHAEPGAKAVNPVRGAPPTGGVAPPKPDSDDEDDVGDGQTRSRDIAIMIANAVNSPMLDPAKSPDLGITCVEIGRWLQAGAQLKRDIIPAIQGVMAKRRPSAGPVCTWGYFTKPVREMAARNMAPVQPIEPASFHVQEPRHDRRPTDQRTSQRPRSFAQQLWDQSKLLAAAERDRVG